MNERYPADAALVICSLIPYLALTAAAFPLLPLISKSTGLSTMTLEVTISVSTGAYAMGTVLAAQLAMHLPPRRLLVGYEAVLVIGSVLAAWAPTGDAFIAGFILQGLATSLLLIAAVPPLITRWPPAKMPVTAVIMNLCIFGAVAVGPTIGAILSTSGSWRPLFWGVACVAGIALLMSLLTFEDDPPVSTDAPWDIVAVALAVVGCAAAFYGAGRLEGTGDPNTASIVPLAGGALLLVALVLYEFGSANPLMPLRVAATTAPVTGIYIALTASAASFTMMELALSSMRTTTTATDTGLLFLPEFAGAILIAGLFGAVFRTRFVPVLAIIGNLGIVASAAILITVLNGGGATIAVATGLLGLGVAATVSPGLFMAGFSLRSALLQRVFAMIELLRAVTAFLISPVLLYLVTVLGSSSAAGTRVVLWICLGIAGAGFLGSFALYRAGCRRLQTPNIDRWQEEGEPAWSSPPVLDRLRGRARA